MVVIPLVVSLAVTLGVLFTLGTNRQPAQDGDTQKPREGIIIKAVVIEAGKLQTFMLRGGRNVAVVDSLTLHVGSEQCRAAVANFRDEIMDALGVIFLSKEVSDLVSPAGVDLLKKNIREAINQITGFVGERERLGVLNVFIYIKAISTVQ